MKTKSLLLLRQAQDGELVELFTKGEFTLFGKEGRGRFSEQYVFSIMDSLVIDGQLNHFIP